MWFWIIIIGIWIIIALIEAWAKKIKKKRLEEADKEIEKIKLERFKAVEIAEVNLKKDTQNAEQYIKQLALERQRGFPWLAKAYEDFFALLDKQKEDYLSHKKYPALRASEEVKEHNRLRREAERKLKIAQYQLEYYENIAPYLVDLKEDIVEDITEEERKYLAEYSEEELADDATKFLTKEEYRKLPSYEKNQLALDRYWKRPKSKWHIGKIYERYVGYLYEERGYDIEYTGIFKGFEDLGRDIIAKKGNEIIVIQCKNWSQFKTIHEKHIFQFFGTVFQYKDENPDKKVKAIFYSATQLSNLARRFAKELNIELIENFKMDNSYPCIKCNVSTLDGTKIYHLPFDQMYDKIKVEHKKGEFYCLTSKEAEDKGFRRAFRYYGLKK